MAQFLDIDALRSFAVVASELNMRRAAEALHISQPPLSRKIKNLEESLGAKLFIRRSFGLELTEAGKGVLEIVGPLLRMQEETQARLDEFKKMKTLAVGFSTAFDFLIYEPVV